MFGISRKRMHKALDTWNRPITTITKKELDEFLITIFALSLFILASVAGTVAVIFFMCFLLTQNAIFFACFIGATGLCGLPIFTAFVAFSIAAEYKAKIESERKFR